MDKDQEYLDKLKQIAKDNKYLGFVRNQGEYTYQYMCIFEVDKTTEAEYADGSKQLKLLNVINAITDQKGVIKLHESNYVLLFNDEIDELIPITEDEYKALYKKVAETFESTKDFHNVLINRLNNENT